MMDNWLTENAISGTPWQPGTFPEFNPQNPTSSTVRIENTKIEAAVYRSLAAFGAMVSIIDARATSTVNAGASDDQRLLDVRKWVLWSQLIRKWFTRDELAAGVEIGLAGAQISADALKFSISIGVASGLGVVIDSARKHFSIVGSPSVRLVRDPETENESFLTIEIQVRGSVRDNVMSHRSFAVETAKSLGRSRGLIKLHYDII